MLNNLLFSPGQGKLAAGHMFVLQSENVIEGTDSFGDTSSSVCDHIKGGLELDL